MQNIPNTDLVVSSLCLGAGSIGSAIPKDDAYRLLDQFVDLGGNFLDTAEIYANWLPVEKSISEKTLGRWMQSRRNRDRLIVATKGAHPRLETMHISRVTERDIVIDLDASLRNLRTDCIDLYYLHRDDPNKPVSEILDIMETQVKQGKIRYYGCSNWQPERIRRAQDYAHSSGGQGFVANQMLWSLAKLNWDNTPDKTIAEMSPAMHTLHRSSGMAAIPYTSQARGFFHKLAKGPADSLPDSVSGSFLTPENLERYKRVELLSAHTGLSITQVVLGYLRSHPFPVIPIVGCHSIVQLRDSMSAQNTILNRDQVTYLERG